MRSIKVVLQVVALVATVGFAADAMAGVGLRLGGTAIVSADDGFEDLDTSTDFLVGVDGDIYVLPALAINLGAQFTTDSDSAHADGYAGLKTRYAIEADAIRMTWKAAAMVKYFFPYDSAGDGGVAVGGVFGPGFEFLSGIDTAFTFELEAYVYKFISPSDFALEDLQAALAFIVGFKF